MGLREPLVLFRIMVFSLCGFCTCWGSENPKSEEEVEAIFEKLFGGSSLDKTEIEKLGNRLIQMNKFEDASGFYAAAIRRNPSEPSYYVQRARCFMKTGHFLFADMDFKEAITIAEETPAGRGMLGLNDAELAKLGERLFEQDYHLKAIFWLSEAIKMNPTKVTYYRLRGKVYLSLGYFDSALPDYKEWIRLLVADKNTEEEALITNNDDLETLGNLLFKKHNYEDAIWCCNQIIDRNASAESVFVLRAQCYMKLKNSDKAISDFRKALQLNSHSLSAWLTLIQVMIRAGKREEIIEETRHVLSDSELMQLGRDFTQVGDFKLAKRFFSEAIKKNPSEPSYYRERGDCYVWLVRFYDAISDFKEALRIDPQNNESRRYLCENLFKYNMWDESLKEILTDQELLSLGNKFMEVAERKDALCFFTAAISVNPENQLCYKQRGICHWKMANFVEAIADLKKSLQLQPNDTPTRVILLQVLVNAEEYDEAAEVLNDLEKKNREENLLSSAELVVVGQARANIEQKFGPKAKRSRS